MCELGARIIEDGTDTRIVEDGRRIGNGCPQKRILSDRQYVSQSLLITSVALALTLIIQFIPAGSVAQQFWLYKFGSTVLAGPVFLRVRGAFF